MIATAHDALPLLVWFCGLAAFGLAIWLAVKGQVVAAVVVAAITLVALVALNV